MDNLTNPVTRPNNPAFAYHVRPEAEIVFTPVEGYIDNQQRTLTPAQMAELGFDIDEHILWAIRAAVGDRKQFEWGTCVFRLERTK
jgi:hypothetical protein